MTDNATTPTTTQPAVVLPKITVWQMTKISNKRERNGFVDVYREAFAGPPYFEKMTKQFVIDHVLRPHLQHGVVLLAEVEGNIVGLAAGYPMLADVHTEIRDFLLAQPKDQVPFDPHFGLFESELATSANIRKIGLGNHLLKSLHRWAWENRFTVYIGRTAAVGSNAIRLHLRNGAFQLPFVQSAGEEEKAVGSAAEQKVWFYGLTEGFKNYGYEQPGSQS